MGAAVLFIERSVGFRSDFEMGSAEKLITDSSVLGSTGRLRRQREIRFLVVGVFSF
jgi:hypothetical protein